MKLILLLCLGCVPFMSSLTIYIAPCLLCAVEEWKWKRAQSKQLPAALLAAKYDRKHRGNDSEAQPRL